MKHFCTHTLLHALHAQSSTGGHDTPTDPRACTHIAELTCIPSEGSHQGMVADMHRFSAYMTHPSCFTLVFNSLLSVWHCPLHIVYRVFHIVLYTVYHLPLGEVGYRGGEGVGHGGGGGVQSGKQGGREGRGGKRENKSVWGCVHLVSHPLAGLFELFAFGDALLRLLHILLSLLHPPLYVVYQAALPKHEKSQESFNCDGLINPKGWKTLSSLAF